jgi:hypothetical protein
MLTDSLKKDRAYVDYKASYRIGDGNTSCFVIDLSQVEIKEELENAMEWQLNDRTLFSVPATFDDESNNPTTNSEDELPF